MAGVPVTHGKAAGIAFPRSVALRGRQRHTSQKTDPKVGADWDQIRL